MRHSWNLAQVFEYNFEEISMLIDHLQHQVNVQCHYEAQMTRESLIKKHISVLFIYLRIIYDGFSNHLNYVNNFDINIS